MKNKSIKPDNLDTSVNPDKNLIPTRIFISGYSDFRVSLLSLIHIELYILFRKLKLILNKDKIFINTRQQ
jgi:hypothetical protein